jgi:hypothetical protein
MNDITTNPPASIRLDSHGRAWRCNSGMWECLSDSGDAVVDEALWLSRTVAYVPVDRIVELKWEYGGHLARERQICAANVEQLRAELAALRQQLNEAQTAIRTLVGDGSILTKIHDDVRQLLSDKLTLDAVMGYELGRAEAEVTTGGCPTCTGPVRETVGMVCQTCGTDYAPDVSHNGPISDIEPAGVAHNDADGHDPHCPAGCCVDAPAATATTGGEA